MAHRYGLYLQDDYLLHDAMKFVQYAELSGFDSVWQAETHLTRDSTVALSAFGAVTTRIKIGSGVTNIWTRNVATIASSFLTLDDLAPDRVICGLGTWYEPLAQMVGVNRRKPLLALRETINTLRALFLGETVTFRGEFVQLQNVSLDVRIGRKGARQIPIYVGATGSKVVALAGEIADGILMNYLVSPAYNDHVMRELERGIHKADRNIDDIDRPQLIVCSVDEDRQRALNRARKLVTQYLVLQPQMMQASGVDKSLLDDLQQVIHDSHEQTIEDAMRLVNDDIVQLITASGTPEEVRRKVDEYVASGVTRPILYPLGDDVRYMVDVFTSRHFS